MGERLTKHDVEKIEKEIEYRKLVSSKGCYRSSKRGKSTGRLEREL